MKNFAKFALVALTVSFLGLSACAKKAETTAETPATETPATETPAAETPATTGDTTKTTAPTEAPKQ
jgi:hypothetical protein